MIVINTSFNNLQINAGSCGAYSVRAFLNVPVAPCIRYHSSPPVKTGGYCFYTPLGCFPLAFLAAKNLRKLQQLLLR